MANIDRKLLLDLVRRRPGVRAVEIADELDMDLEHAVRLLDEAVQQGVIEVKQVSAALGHTVGSYTMGATLEPQADNPSVPLPAAPATAAPEARDASHGTAATPAVPRTELAITFLKSCGDNGADIHQLRAAMKLGPGQSPSNFLTTARERGQIVVHGGRWRYVEQAEAKPKTPKRPMDVAETFRIGEWSDGVVELERGGQRLAMLSAVEREQLRAFLNRSAA